MTRKSYLAHAAQEGASVEYIEEARGVARSVESASDPGCEEWDLAQYADRLIQEVYALRSRVAYLEGWKEAAEAADSQRKQA